MAVDEGNPILVPTHLNIAGREFAYREMDASVPQVVLDALHQAFVEIDKLEKRIEAMPGAPVGESSP